jgi:hypothetical protein
MSRDPWTEGVRVGLWFAGTVLALVVAVELLEAVL